MPTLVKSVTANKKEIIKPHATGELFLFIIDDPRHLGNSYTASRPFSQTGQPADQVNCVRHEYNYLFARCFVYTNIVRQSTQGPGGIKR